MKNFKSILLIFVVALILVPTVQSCKKYPDGPGISFRSRTARLCNSWKVENYKINGNDFTSLVADYTEVYSKNNNFSYSWGKMSGTGTWSFQNKDEEIKIVGVDGKESRTCFILRLEEKSLWYYYMDGNDRNELHLISN